MEPNFEKIISDNETSLYQEKHQSSEPSLDITWSNYNKESNHGYFCIRLANNSVIKKKNDTLIRGHIEKCPKRTSELLSSDIMVAHIDLVEVASELQHKGIAKFLLGKLINKLKENNIKFITSVPINIKSYSLYMGILGNNTKIYDGGISLRNEITPLDAQNKFRNNPDYCHLYLLSNI